MKKNQIEFPDFEKLDLRVGEIKGAEKIEKSKKLLKLQIDLGEDYGIVQILSGIAEYYQPEDLVGKKIVCIANLAPREMMGQTSNGMLLAADLEGKPMVLQSDSEVIPGTIVR